MSNQTEHSDAKLSEPARQLLLPGFSSDGDKAESRVRQRHSFDAIHKIAARVGPELPRASEFFSVRCYDLSEQGFSFLLRNPPSFKQLVGAFATPQNITYVAAEVQHYTDVVLSRSGEVRRINSEAVNLAQADSVGESGTRMVLIGCRFTEHLGTEARGALW